MAFCSAPGILLSLFNKKEIEEKTRSKQEVVAGRMGTSGTLTLLLLELGQASSPFPLLPPSEKSRLHAPAPRILYDFHIC